MTYEELTNKIENSRRFGGLPGVTVTARMLRELGSPERGMRFIHIAGTNGKGSVSAFLCRILSENGLRVGMFTSPHLVDFAERIRIGDERIGHEDVARIGEKIVSMDFGVQPTMFDYCMVIALIYFKEQKCDVVILETGLGGRLDSTNAIGVPDVTVITKIGYDHMAILGNSIEEIAYEKAGIIKSGTRLISESQEDKAYEVLRAKADEAGLINAKLINLNEIKEISFDGEYQHFSIDRYKDLRMGMLGIHQFENAYASILSAQAMCDAFGITLSEEAVRVGIEKTVWRGRMEILSRDPFFIVDGAHNPNGAAALRDSLSFLYPGKKFHFVMGVMADKDYSEMIDILSDIAVDFVTMTVESERALQAKELAGYIKNKGIAARAGKMSDLSGLIQQNGFTCAFGSLYFIGEILALNCNMQ
jgi:dihydrofolate synthase/folylpolyglutamate synthase